MIVAGLLLLTGASWTLGTLVLRRPAGLHALQWLAFVLTIGLGLTAIGLSLLLLLGWFAAATTALALLSVPAALALVRGVARDASLDAFDTTDRMLVVAVACVGLACLGAFAPVTDYDGLSYVIPEALRIAATGELTVWPDLARSMWPLSQQVLLAYLISIGGAEFTGLLTALQLLLCVGTISALAGRVCAASDHVGAALVIALGSPAVAFLAASTKEDLLVVSAAAATAFYLVAPAHTRAWVAAGLFAGVAAGAKYPGLGVLVAAVAWAGLTASGARLKSAAIVALAAVPAGGLWYALNVIRFGNPVAPLVFGAAGTPMDAEFARALVDGYGMGMERSVLTFLTVPVHIFIEPDRFCGRANLFNPLAYAAVFALAGQWRRHAPLFFMAAVLYAGWFFMVQNARLLLPATVLLAPAAADVLVPLVRRHLAVRAAAVVAVILSLGVVAAVGAVRAYRFVSAPAAFLERETQRHLAIEWMNTHLDPARHRVGAWPYALARLRIPFLYLDESHQMEIRNHETVTAASLIAACRRQGITHLLGADEDFAGFEPFAREVYRNDTSRLGGVRFFREPPTERTVVLEILPEP